MGETFNPLGRFDPKAPINPGVLDKAKVLYRTLADVDVGGLTRIYLHWSAGAMSNCDSAYNVEALIANNNWALKITHDPQDNVLGLNDNAEASHTYKRNTGAVGVAITGMDGPGVNPHDFGEDPVTVMGLTHLCAAAAAVAAKYSISIAGVSSGEPYGGEPPILTHAEAAIRVGNPPQYQNYGIGPGGTMERWDLASFASLPPGLSLTPQMAYTCGNALRSVCRQYKVALL